MKQLRVGDITIDAVIEREGPWRRPQDFFPATSTLGLIQRMWTGSITGSSGMTDHISDELYLSGTLISVDLLEFGMPVVSLILRSLPADPREARSDDKRLEGWGVYRNGRRGLALHTQMFRRELLRREPAEHRSKSE
jgi:hypothetical protein